jgi:eukaryotic-like serine/threonine-protein kinase
MAIANDVLPARYRDPRSVGHGGMGDVYCAVDAELGRPVAVKVLSEAYSSSGGVRERFTREALAAARLSGEPNIVTVYDVGEWRGRPFIVMEYVPGGSLEDLLGREGVQPPGRALRWLEEAASALDRAHQRGVVHRDVKPANLLLDERGHVHVADFGVASAAGLESLTETGTVLGTAGYLAPEQAQGGETSPATDQYGLAVVAFQLLTGSRPFQRDSAAAEAAAQAFEPVPSASARNRRLPKEVDAVFRRALAKRPQERFRSCMEFVAELGGAFSAGQRATRVMRPAPRRRRRSLLPMMMMAMLFALVAGGIAAALVTSRTHSPPQAERITITEPGSTVRETVTAQPPPSTPPPTTSSAPTAPATPQTTSAAGTPTSTSASSLAQQGYQRLQAGDAAGALPLLQQAAQALQGTNSLAEAYNDYNLAVAIAQTQGCSPQVLQLLDASETIQGHRGPINKLRNACRNHSTG